MSMGLLYILLALIYSAASFASDGGARARGRAWSVAAEDYSLCEAYFTERARKGDKWIDGETARQILMNYSALTTDAEEARRLGLAVIAAAGRERSAHLDPLVSSRIRAITQKAEASSSLVSQLSREGEGAVVSNNGSWVLKLNREDGVVSLALASTDLSRVSSNLEEPSFSLMPFLPKLKHGGSEAYTPYVTPLAVSDSGRFAVLSGEGINYAQWVYVLDLRERRVIQRFDLSPHMVTSAQFSSEDRLLAVTGFGNVSQDAHGRDVKGELVSIYELDESGIDTTYQQRARILGGLIRRYGFSNDRRSVAIVSSLGGVELWYLLEDGSLDRERDVDTLFAQGFHEGPFHITADHRNYMKGELNQVQVGFTPRVSEEVVPSPIVMRGFEEVELLASDPDGQLMVIGDLKRVPEDAAEQGSGPRRVELFLYEGSQLSRPLLQFSISLEDVVDLLPQINFQGRLLFTPFSSGNTLYGLGLSFLKPFPR